MGDDSRGPRPPAPSDGAGASEPDDRQQKGRRRRAARTLILPANLLIGYAAVVPLVLGQYGVRNTLLVRLGWATPQSIVNDGPDLPLVLGAVTLLPLFVVWYATNRTALEAGQLPRRPWCWVAASVLVLVPYLLAVLWPDGWRDVGWTSL